MTAVDERPLWAIAAYDGDEREPWPVSHAEIDRSIGGAASALAALGVRAGAHVLWCSVLSEAAHFWPLTIATMLNGGVFSLADATHADALRTAMFTRRLTLHAVFGVNDAVLDGLDDLGRDYAETFAGVAVIGARSGAYERLAAAGLAPHWFVLCGPAVAIATEPGGPARVDPDEWSLDCDGDRVLVTSLRPRAQTFARAPTAVHGRLVDATGFVPYPTGGT